MVSSIHEENNVRSTFQQIISKSILGLAVLCSAPFAMANDVNWSVTVGSPQPYYSAQPVYSAPHPVYVRPAPVYVQPQPVYVRPAPIVQSSAYVQYGAPVIVQERWDHDRRGHGRGHGHGHGHGNGHWKHH
jgi:hypothetical protein